MKKLLVFGTLLLHAILSYSQWEEVETEFNNHLLGVFAKSEDVVYVCGSGGLIVKSVDQGENWTVQSSQTGQDLYSIFFFDANTGFAVGNEGVFLKTVDAGETWVKTTISDEHLRQVYFQDLNHGFIGANHGIILRTDDGGSSWTVIDTGLPLGIYDFAFLDMTHGCTIGYYGEICVTNDGGLTWEITEDISNNQMNCLFSFGSGETIAVGDGGVVKKSQEDYANWVNIDTPNQKFYSGIDFLNDQNGYIVGGDVQQNEGYMMISTDGGDSWTEDLTGTSRLYGIDFAPEKTCGYIVGLDGTFLRMCTTNEVVEEAVDTGITLAVYPVPAVHWVKVKSPENKTPIWVGCKVFDSTGNVVISKDFAAIEEVEIDIRSLRAGEYKVLLIHQDGRQANASFIKY